MGGYAKLLALSGVEIDCYDILQMNLATHATDTPERGLHNYLEVLLSDIPGYDNQAFVPKTPEYHGENPMPDLANAPYRNRVVANLLDDVSCAQSFKEDFFATMPNKQDDIFEDEITMKKE